MLPAMSETAVDESQDVKAGFAGLMSKAAGQAGAAEEAPFGYTTDPDGTRRPKKTAGRPRKSPSVEELKAEKDAQVLEGIVHPPAEDRAPGSGRRGQRAGGARPDDKKPVVQFREGVIAKGMNKLYRKAGKMVRVVDADVGQALIDITRKDTLDDGKPDPEDVTVGEAWEELARTNPRIRAVLMKMIAGGAVGQLFMVHSPVLLAILMKDAIRKRIPFMKLVEAFLDNGEDGEAPADGTVAEGLTVPDMDQMMAMARQFAEQAMGRNAGGTPRPPEAPPFHVEPDGETGEVVTVPPARGPVGPGITAAVPAASGS
jgi:hypothetical protein